MKGCPSRDELRRVATGTMDVSRLEQIERHLDHCLTCQRMLLTLTDEAKIVPATCTHHKVPPPTAQLQKVLDNLTCQGAGRGSVTDLLSRPSQALEQFPFLKPTERPGFLGKLETYEIRRVIGRGGMGTVFEAMDPVLNRQVAIKILSPFGAWNTEARERFLREAQAAAALAHEHVVAIYGVHLHGQVPFLVMQYVEGESLADRLIRLGPLPLAEVVRLGIEASRGLAAAHAKGLVHRDIKPANLLLEKDTGRVKIADFGLAKNLSDATLTMEGTVAGTPEFMSPEQAQGKEVDARSDMFSLGAVLYLAACGVSPFAAPDVHLVLERVRQANVRPLREIDPTLPAWFRSIIMRLLAREPKDRIQSASALADLLERAEPPVPVSQKLSRWRVAALAGLASMMLAAIVAIGFGPWPFQKAPNPPKVDQPSGPGFRILGRQAAFASLADALEAAEENDVIEIYGDGPFTTTPLSTRGKRLTIRSSPSFKPVLVSDVPNRANSAPLITADADLRLEGITIYWTTEAPALTKTETSMLTCAAVASTRGELHLANCHIVATNRSGCVSASCPTLTLSRCHLACENGLAVFWRPSPEGHLNLEECLLEGNTALTLLTGTTVSSPKPAKVTLHQNTFANEKILQFVIQVGPKQTYQFSAHKNLFAGPQMVNLYATRIPRNLLPDSAEKSIAHLRSIAAWKDQHNVYRRGMSLSVDSVLVPRTVHETPLATLTDWLSIWNLSDNSSIEGDIRFHLRDRKETAPLRLESIENSSGPVPDGVGADPERVGPSAAAATR